MPRWTRRAADGVEGGPRNATASATPAADDGRQTRQLGVVAADGDGATFTGRECHAWAGGVSGDGYAIQGNILTGPDVVQEMQRAFLDNACFAKARQAATAAHS